MPRMDYGGANVEHRRAYRRESAQVEDAISVEEIAKGGISWGILAK